MDTLTAWYRSTGSEVIVAIPELAAERRVPAVKRRAGGGAGTDHTGRQYDRLAPPGGTCPATPGTAGRQ